MERSDNQCERKSHHFHCPSTTAAIAVPIRPYRSTTTSSACGQSNQSLDTVRSLHQTVVSLRTALDDARREITNLKKQMNVNTVIEEGKAFKENDPQHRPIEDSSTTSLGTVEGAAQKMGSQIDVKIRVSSNVNVSTGGGDGATAEEMNKSGADSSRSVVSIKLTSQEDLNVSQQNQNVYSFNQSTNEDVQLGPRMEEEGENGDGDGENPRDVEGETENLDEDKSLSDGDNSVFDDSKEEEGGVRTVNVLRVPHPKIQRAHSDTQEEVDDIELIFSSDDHKELIHEDEMVSISATYEPWQKPGSSGTPVLLSFERLSLDDDHALSQRRKTTTCGDAKPKDRKKNVSVDQVDVDTMKITAIGSSKWNKGNKTELHVTDISKCGISDENIMDMSRRNTCPNPPVYRPLSHSQREYATPRTRHSLSANRCILGGTFSRPGVRRGLFTSSPARNTLRSPLIAITNTGNVEETPRMGPKRSSSVQTDISALPEQWQSESHLAGGCYGNGLFTLPSKYNPIQQTAGHCSRIPLRPSEKTQEARRILLSDINFTSMIPELSRSADHLCPEDEENTDEVGNSHGEHQEERHQQQHQQHHQQRMTSGCHSHGNHLQTPNLHSCRNKGLTPSASINSHGSMNENSFATQTTQTGDYWIHKGDSFDSTSCYTNDSRLSLNKSCRSRSVPSIKCVYCKRSHGFNAMRTSESLHYTPRVLAIPESYGTVKGSLPDLRHDCCCPRRYQGHSLAHIHGQSSGSTESLIDDAETFIRRSSSNNVTNAVDYHSRVAGLGATAKPNRRCSENDIGRSYTPSKQSLPFLPKTENCLKIGHLAKVIARNGRVVVGQVRYVGPICNSEYVAKLDGGTHDTFIGLELPSTGGDTDGTIEGKRFFYCGQNQGIFVPFSKVIMAWMS